MKTFNTAKGRAIIVGNRSELKEVLPSIPKVVRLSNRIEEGNNDDPFIAILNSPNAVIMMLPAYEMKKVGEAILEYCSISDFVPVEYDVFEKWLKENPDQEKKLRGKHFIFVKGQGVVATGNTIKETTEKIKDIHFTNPTEYGFYSTP
jgi:hypothetical protein